MDRHIEFENLKPRLLSLAYRMLGSRSDAEDVVQDAYLRWQSLNENEDVKSPGSYLTTIVARLSLDALKSARRKREIYVGPWLPEPIIEPLGAHSVELAESLSLAFLHLLESLSPAERVALLLHDVFDADYAEVAAALQTTEANSRQIVSRARGHLQARRPRFPVDREQHQRVLRAFLQASASGNPSQLAALLGEDARAYSDGGGKAPAALNPIIGRDRVARLLIGIAKKRAGTLAVKLVDINGETGVLLLASERPFAIMTIHLDAAGLIKSVFIVNNPDKLRLPCFGELPIQ